MATLEYNQIYSSKRISQFLDSVQPGEHLGFFDVDQTLWKAGIDMEDLAFREFGLIDFQRYEDWKAKIADAESQGGDQHLVDLRGLNLSYYPPTVDSVISKFTKVQLGTKLNSSVVRDIGWHVGQHIFDKKLFRPVAMDTLRMCEEQNIRVIAVSASPVELVEGSLGAVQERLSLPAITPLGTEDYYDPSNGRVSEVLFMYGPTKTAVVEAAKERGGIAIVGAGDKFTSSDVFIQECLLNGAINNEVEGGELSWNDLYQKLQARTFQGNIRN